MNIEIKHRWSVAVLFSAEVGSLKLAVELAVKQRADLRRADLAGADLTGADLRGAYLTGADLKDAYLTDADLRGAYLTGADLTGADLKGAVGLKDAFMDGEPLKHATPEQSVANLDKVREIILDNTDRLDMGTWHRDGGWVKRSCAEEAVCGTSHCLAGWLQVCSTDKNIRALDAQLAGILSAPVAAKMFFCDAHEVLTWLRKKKYAD